MDLAIWARYARKRIYKTNDIIFPEGETDPYELFILLSGEAQIYKNYGKNNAVFLSTITPGQIFGELSFFSGIPRNTTVIVTQDVIAISIAKENYLELSRNSPEAAYQIAQMLSERLDAANKTIIALSNKEQGVPPVIDGLTLLDTKSSIFPKGHGSYPVVQPDIYKEYIVLMNKHCPVCDQPIEVYRQLTSKQKPYCAPDNDTRRYIIDFEPLWYNITTCPSCYFSMFDESFDKPKNLIQKDIGQKLEIVRKKILIDFSVPKTLDIVFAAYYTALLCSTYYINFKQIQARIWLELSWLYHIASDIQMCIFATEKAIGAYARLYLECSMSTESEQNCCLILGSLYQRMGDYDQALKYYYNAKTKKGGSRAYVKSADDAIYTIREKIRKDNNEVLD